MFSLFNWLRNQVKAAVLAGVGDALQELEGTGTDDTAAALVQVRIRLAPTLTKVPTEASGVYQDEAAAETTHQTVPHKNGRRKATAPTE
jgi:hypothetical protein